MDAVSGWRKCDTCRKVRPGDEFDGGAPTCRTCQTAPARRRSSAVTRSSTTPRTGPSPSASVPAGPRKPLLGSVGAGDLEVRERRARRAAHEALAASHAEEFEILLRDAREAEGLRSLG